MLYILIIPLKMIKSLDFWFTRKWGICKKKKKKKLVRAIFIYGFYYIQLKSVIWITWMHFLFINIFFIIFWFSKLLFVNHWKYICMVAFRIVIENITWKLKTSFQIGFKALRWTTLVLCLAQSTGMPIISTSTWVLALRVGFTYWPDINWKKKGIINI